MTLRLGKLNHEYVTVKFCTVPQVCSTDDFHKHNTGSDKAMTCCNLTIFQIKTPNQSLSLDPETYMTL